MLSYPVCALLLRERDPVARKEKTALFLVMIHGVRVKARTREYRTKTNGAPAVHDSGSFVMSPSGNGTYVTSSRVLVTARAQYGRQPDSYVLCSLAVLLKCLN